MWVRVMRLSDYIGKFLIDRGVDTVFTITGAGNVRLIEAASQAGIQHVCPHHEQAAVIASLTRWRISGKPAVCLVTGGPGATNTLTALADAYLDSTPCILIAGQEKVEFVTPPNALRGKGVQGLNMVDMVSGITKFAVCLTHPTEIRSVLEQAFCEAYSDRPGPVWIEVPQDLQWAEIAPDSLVGYRPQISVAPPRCDMLQAAHDTLELLRRSHRPLLWVGHGIRLAQCEAIFRRVFELLSVPALVSWQAADLVPDEHPLYVGRAGVYGQRWANLALQNCDLLITLGTRLALPQRGYVDAEFARAANKVIVEIDPAEMAKFNFPIAVPAVGDVKDFLTALNELLSLDISKKPSFDCFEQWSAKCREWRGRYPMSQPPKIDKRNTSEGINSYWFIDRLSDCLSPGDIVVTDMGTSLTCTHATIRLKEGQRLLTSTGLGEMGFGLPGAIGAALGARSRRVVLIVGEGSLMMNLQELQTLHYLQLPIKIFLLNNNGYLTIKHTHNALFASQGDALATNPKTGVSFPDFAKIAPAFGLSFSRIADPAELDSWIQSILTIPGSVLAEVVMPEYQELIPKSSLKLNRDGTLYSPPLEDLYPFLAREQLEQEMIVPMLVPNKEFEREL